VAGVALSFWAYDLVMQLSTGSSATVVPAYYFVGAFLSGFAWVALVTAIRGTSGPDLRHDVGKLLFGFIIVWTYLLWSLFLATWYANVPEESAPLLLRWQGGYRPVSQAVLLAVFFWPFWLLFSERFKRRRGTLAGRPPCSWGSGPNGSSSCSRPCTSAAARPRSSWGRVSRLGWLASFS